MFAFLPIAAAIIAFFWKATDSIDPTVPANVLLDVITTPHNISCWKKEEKNYPVISDEVYKFCLYTASPFNYQEYYLAGIGHSGEAESDENAEIARLLEGEEVGGTGYAGTVICVQMALQLSVAGPSEMTLRCICRRNSCNVPGDIGNLFEVNKNVLKRKI